MNYKNKGYAFVSIDELIHSKSILPKKQVNISFDDGFRDIYTNAFPIFKKHHIPFTIYLTTDFPEGKADIWWIQMEQYRTVDEYEDLMKQIFSCKRPMAGMMHELTDTQPDLGLCRSLALSWEEIQEMVNSGLCTIGSHTISHPGLTRIGEDARRRELEDSRQIIKERIGREVFHFSYPHSMEDEDVRRAVSKAGYTSAALGYGGTIRRGDDRFRLNRKYIVQK